MNLIQYYTLFNKILKRISLAKNNFYRISAIRLMIRASLKYGKVKVNKVDILNNVNQLLGNFENFKDNLKNFREANDILLLADKTIAHEFDYLGSNYVKLNPIDWHFDFKSGYKWPNNKFYMDYKLIMSENDSDVKVPWELSRCHHLLWLGEAYLITKDNKYAKEIIDQIYDWIDKNSLMYSINWTCSMEVAIRSVNWLYAVNMISSSPMLSHSFLEIFYLSLKEHGFFIYNNLEKTFPFSTNHYAANICGLLFLGQLFKNTSYGNKWWKYGISEFFSEVRTQVLPSGVHFEKSISYHRLMTEMFSYTYLMLKRLNEHIPLDIELIIRNMFDFIGNYIKPNGHAPLIGDDDNGRFLPFMKYTFSDHRYLLSIATIIYKDGFFKYKSGKYFLDNYFILGRNSLNEFNHVKKVNYPNKSQPYFDAGFYIVRNNETYLFINNSGLSRYPETSRNNNGSHTHADLLSFVLVIKNVDVFIDPGTYTYTGSFIDRNEFRSTRKHNTITIDELDQHELSSTDMFGVNQFAIPETFKLNETSTLIKYIGSYSIKRKNNQICYHKRMIILHKTINELIITDIINFVGDHTFEMYFHFAPNFSILQNEGTLKVNLKNMLNINLTFECERKINLHQYKDAISSSYGKIINSDCIKVSANFNSLIEIKTRITW